MYVEWDQFEGSERGDSGEVTYRLAGTPHVFQIQARATDDCMLQVLFENLSAAGNPKGSVLPLGWMHNRSTVFILAGTEGHFVSNQLPTNWMQMNRDVLSARSLRHLCIPGAHDAGMSQYNGHTFLAKPCNTLTQVTSIYGQLERGVRYFDLRPVISSGEFWTGHYSHIEIFGSWQGANGQSIASIIDDVNRYTEYFGELIILRLSHDLNTDVGNSSYRPFNQEEWNGLFKNLLRVHRRFIVDDPRRIDLTALPLDTFIGQGNSAVILLIDPSDPEVRVGEYANHGFYSTWNFNTFDSYSNTADPSVMMADQLDKLEQKRKSPDDSYFLLSWTLTQNALQAATCSLGTANSILDLASQANPLIYRHLLPKCSRRTYPNILYLDQISSPTVAALAMAVNTVSAAD